MERIIIMGCGGSGKSTLARNLGSLTGLPVVHLDQIWWAPGNWQHITREEFDEKLAREVEKPRWILDGNYDRTLPVRLQRCDTVIYLDLPRAVCLLSWIRRVITNWGYARQDMAPGCAEWFDPEMAGWIWSFNRKNRHRYHDLLNLARAEGKTVHILKNRRQVQRFLQNTESRLS